MLVTTRSDGRLVKARFDELPSFLVAGDLLVVNTSATLPASLPAHLEGHRVELHLSTPTADGCWVVEVRSSDRLPIGRPPVGARVELPGEAQAQIVAPYGEGERLCVARLSLPLPLSDYLHRHGHPIRYPHSEGHPIDDYQTVFALEPGSAEMPSAARPFTTPLVTELVARGVLFAPLSLHTGVSSLERGETPSPERFRVPPTTARLTNAVRSWGGRVIAVGTSVVRALETVASPDGTVAPDQGSTSLIVTPERGLRAIDGLLSGWHEPDSSHLQLLEAAAGADLLQSSYRAAREHGFRWHELGDAHLILP